MQRPVPPDFRPNERLSHTDTPSSSASISDRRPVRRYLQSPAPDDTDPSGESMCSGSIIGSESGWGSTEDRLIRLDYYERLYQYAIALIRKGKATSVTGCGSDPEYRGTMTNRQGKPFPPIPRRISTFSNGCGPGISRWNAGAAARSTCPLRTSGDARSHHVPYQEREPLPYGRQVGASTDVRLRPLPLDIIEGITTRTALGSSRTTGRCTTGS